MVLSRNDRILIDNFALFDETDSFRKDHGWEIVIKNFQKYRS